MSNETKFLRLCTEAHVQVDNRTLRLRLQVLRLNLTVRLLLQSLPIPVVAHGT